MFDFHHLMSREQLTLLVLASYIESTYDLAEMAAVMNEAAVTTEAAAAAIARLGDAVADLGDQP